MTGRNLLHPAGTFPLTQAEHLPLTGERHPLRREFAKWLGWGNGIALVAGLILFGAWVLWTHRHREAAPVYREVKIVRYTELGVPPSISRGVAAVSQVSIAQAVAPPSIGVPEPVPDIQAPTATIATQEEMSEALEPITVSGLGGGGGGGESLVVRVDTTAVERSPTPDEFVPVEQEPVLIRIAKPVFPDVAMAAGVEGTVMVRVLVGKDGKVRNALVVDGHEMLKDAAIVCAKTALFKPALVENKPVEVWVLIPVIFKFNN